MEGLTSEDFWRGKRVLLTGHTGFKGSWLGLWLSQLGAEVFGFALAPQTNPALFDQARIADAVDHELGDIRNVQAIAARVGQVQPDVVFHLAAQPLVLQSYKDPLETWGTNVMGTANLLHALQGLEDRCAVVIVTTDKVYHNNEWEFAYRETDRLGGHDPYSASKAATELVVSSWQKSFFANQPQIAIATARAGNVIGGGDWSDNRIVPDITRALAQQEVIKVRNPSSTRPWQHVLDPLAGYLTLAQRLYDTGDQPCADAYNFGPQNDGIRTVRDLVETALQIWPGRWEDMSDPNAPHEAQLLSLTIDRAQRDLGWVPRWDFAQAVSQTIDWYRQAAEGADLRQVTSDQIKLFGAP